MKKLLLFSLVIVFQSFFCQIQFAPFVNHDYQPYYATLSGSGTIYYTTDGSEPTINSASGYQTVNITISQNTVVKSRLKSYAGVLSEVVSRNYYFGDLPQKTVYFKPPTNWNKTCSQMYRIDPETLVDFYGPGNNMTTVCEGWYKANYAFYKASVSFNNCSPIGIPPYYQGVDVITEDTIFYDYSEGPISNPPTCLLAVNDASKKIAIVKIFPNPVQDFVNIESDKNFIAYEVIDESGRSILNRDFKGTKIDISNLKTGIYFIKLKSLNNETNIVKFIKK